jgi:hypothetical protein
MKIHCSIVLKKANFRFENQALKTGPKFSIRQQQGGPPDWLQCLGLSIKTGQKHQKIIHQYRAATIPHVKHFRIFMTGGTGFFQPPGDCAHPGPASRPDNQGANTPNCPV